MKLSNKVYDYLMFIAQVALPGIATLYAAVGGIWGLPDITAVVGTLAAVDTGLGGMLKTLKSGYIPPTDGTLKIDKSGENDKYTFTVDTDPADLEKQKSIVFEVVKNHQPA